MNEEYHLGIFKGLEFMLSPDYRIIQVVKKTDDYLLSAKSLDFNISNSSVISFILYFIPAILSKHLDLSSHKCLVF